MLLKSCKYRERETKLLKILTMDEIIENLFINSNLSIIIIET